LQCNCTKKGGNSNLIDCNAIAQKKGGNSNLIDYNAIAQNKKREVKQKREVAPI
jgi:hypothetical protein